MQKQRGDWENNRKVEKARGREEEGEGEMRRGKREAGRERGGKKKLNFRGRRELGR